MHRAEHVLTATLKVKTKTATFSLNNHQHLSMSSHLIVSNISTYFMYGQMSFLCVHMLMKRTIHMASLSKFKHYQVSCARQRCHQGYSVHQASGVLGRDIIASSSCIFSRSISVPDLLHAGVNNASVMRKNSVAEHILAWQQHTAMHTQYW